MNTSLIIPTYNKSARLKFMLKSLLLLEDRNSFEVIIVNDGSTDSTELLLKQFLPEADKEDLNIKIIKIENSGRSVARNRGASEAKGELLVFSDDDIILSPGFIKAHEQAHQKGSHNVVRGIIYDLPYLKFFKDPETGELFDSSMKSTRGLQQYLLGDDCIEPGLKKIRSQARLIKFEKDIHQLYSITPEDHPLRWVGCTGGNISVGKKDFFHAGGFDSKLGKAWGCEDLEFGYRIKKSAGNIVMADNAENFHISHFRVNAGSEHEQAMAYFFARHKDQSINELGRYFEGSLSSLSEWKSIMDK